MKNIREVITKKFNDVKAIRLDQQTDILKLAFWGVAFIYFVTMYSMDNPVIFEAAYYRLDCLFKGNLMDFLFDWSPIVPYSVFSQFFFCIWVLPVKILSIVFSTSLDSSIGAFLWYKLLIVLFFLLSVKETKKIADVLGRNADVEWIGLFMLSSLFSVLPVFHLAQVDVIYMPFMLYGVRKYIEGDYRRFIIAFVIANPVKYLSIFVYVPLILLKQKKILNSVRDVLLGLVFVPVELITKNMTNILYKFGLLAAQDVRVPYTLASSQIRALLFNGFSGPDGIDASVVVVAYSVICILAYCCYYEDDKRGDLTIWLSFSSLAVLFTFGTMHCQWVILLVPFMILLLFMNDRDVRIKFILEALIPMSFIGGYVITQSQIYGGRDTFDSLLLSLNQYLMNRRSSHSNSDLIHFIMDKLEYPGEYERILPAIAVVGMVTFMIISYPFFSRKEKNTCSDVEKQQICRFWGWFRVVILAAWFLLNFYCLFK